MPRLTPSLLRRAGRISPHLATLLPACRTVESAQAELRWIRRHVLEDPPAAASQINNRSPPVRGARPAARSRSGNRSAAEDHIARLVARRGAGEPLQYVLGTQPFGDLEILCEKGVLIPRPETEAWAAMLADLALSSRQDLRILDLCSGTGCIGLSLYGRGMALRRGTMRLFGFDVEPRAVRLARKNLRHNFRGSQPEYGQMVAFEQADIFTDEWMASLDNPVDGQRQRQRIDVLVSNPPYISQRGFNMDTGRNVRNHEPKLALVPSRPPSPTCAPEDVFYARLLEIADMLHPRIAAFEVGDMAQAIRVVEIIIRRPDPGGGSQRANGDELSTSRWEGLEIWRDWPDCLPSETEEDVVIVCGRKVPVRGSGHGRVVFLSEGPILRSRFANRGFKREVYTAQ